MNNGWLEQKMLGNLLNTLMAVTIVIHPDTMRQNRFHVSNNQELPIYQTW